MSQSINLNLVPCGSPPVVYASATDAGRVINATVYDGDDPYDVPTDATVTVHGRNGSGDEFSVSGTASGSVVTFSCTDAMTEDAGAYISKMKIKTDSISISSQKFVIQIVS